uniref:Uncharacterized protein n=1 Tax=viral metagenome TaxID=1070528 RepID=A0A6M3J1R8_9ZZZZ
MIIFRNYIPNFVEGVESKIIEVETTEQLLSLSFIKKWKDDKDFYRFSKSKYFEDYYLLMAEFKEGKVWWVVGYLTGEKDKVELPMWKKI